MNNQENSKNDSESTEVPDEIKNYNENLVYVIKCPAC